MNYMLERMENIPGLITLQERHKIDLVPNESQLALTADLAQTRPIPSKSKVEERDNEETKNIFGNRDLSINNHEDVTLLHHYQNIPFIPSFQDIQSFNVPLLRTCQPEEYQQKLLPSASQTERPVEPRPNTNKISINSLLNQDNSHPFSDNNNIESAQIPNLLTIVRKKRELEPTTNFDTSESKRPCGAPAIAQPTPIEAQVISFTTPVVPTSQAYVTPFMAYPVQYVPSLISGGAPHDIPVEGLLAMAAAASELGEPSEINAGQPGSPTAPGPIQELYDELWMKHFNQLKEFKAQFGHCNVTRTKAEWKSLGNWVAEQRRKMRQGKLTQQQYEMLTAQGFEWDRSYFFKAAVPIQAMYESEAPQPVETSPHASRKKKN